MHQATKSKRLGDGRALRALAQGRCTAVCKEFQSAIKWSSESAGTMVNPVTAYVSIHRGGPSGSLNSRDAVWYASGRVKAVDENGVSFLKGRLTEVWTSDASGMVSKPSWDLDVEIIPSKGITAVGEVRYALVVNGEPKGTAKTVVKCACVSDALMSGSAGGRVVSVGVFLESTESAIKKIPIGEWQDGPAKEPPGGWGRQ